MWILTHEPQDGMGMERTSEEDVFGWCENWMRSMSECAAGSQPMSPSCNCSKRRSRLSRDLPLAHAAGAGTWVALLGYVHAMAAKLRRDSKVLGPDFGNALTLEDSDDDGAEILEHAEASTVADEDPDGI
eukprot:6475514-Amphidinium_carterae.1